MPQVPVGSENAHFAVLAWRTGIAKKSEVCFTQLSETNEASDRLEAGGAYARGGVYRWADDRIGWTPISSWPDDFDGEFAD